MSHVKGHVRTTKGGRVVVVKEYLNARMPEKHPESGTHRESWHAQFNLTHDALLATLNNKSKFYDDDKDKLERHLRTRSIEELKETYGRINHKPTEHDIKMATSGNMVNGEGKDTSKPKPTASERGMVRHKEQSSIFKKSRQTKSGAIVFTKE